MRRVFDMAVRDFIYALRILRRNPGFTIVAVFTLGLGIGANTAIFSVIDAVLLKPLPYSDPRRLIAISQTDLQTQATGAPVSFTKFTQVRQQTQTLDSVAAFYPLNFSLTVERAPEAVPGARVSADFFTVLGILPARGRAFSGEEDQRGGANVAVVSDAFWRSHFGGHDSLLGRTLTLDGKNVTVIGILPDSFRFPLQYPEPEIWVPRVFERDDARPEMIQTGASYLSVVGKLRSGQTLAQAQAELKTMDARYKAQFGGFVDATRFQLAATSLDENLVGALRPSLLVLLSAVAFVLLIACANVANLLLARATAREREVAIRNALGASSGRLARQFLTESLCLSFIGGAFGVFLAFLLLPTLRALSPGTLPRLAEATIDPKVLLFSVSLCLLTGLIFGIAPSLQASRKVVQSALQEGGRGSSQGGGRVRFRSMLVVAEMAVALVLIAGAGLLIESFAHLMRVDPGLNPKGVMTFPVSLPANRYTQPEQIVEFYRQVLDKVKGMPEVQSASFTSHLPLSGNARFIFFCPEGRACQGIGKDPTAQRQVTPGYFHAVQTQLLRGRVFSDSDTAGAGQVAIINQTTAGRYFPGQNPIGKRIANSRDRIPREIVGVVADVKVIHLGAPPVEELYLPLAQVPWLSAALLVRSEANSQPLVAAVRGKIAEVDPNLPVSGILSMEDVVAGSVAQPLLIAQFVGVFAGFALLLAAIGMYGVMAYSVTQRKQELGIRVAMGATPSDILRLVVGQGVRLTLVGVGIGVAASLFLTRLLSGLLFGVQTLDPLAFTAATIILVSAAGLACYLPARRATRSDPVVVLRFQ
jgi:putative ABC transport system permease protein